MSRPWAALALAAMTLVWGAPAAAQQPASETTAVQAPVILVVDVSGSMDEDDGKGTRKIEGAQQALLDYLDGIQSGAPLGLRTYPNQGGESCNSGKVQFPVGPAEPAEMSAFIRGLEPDGDTPTAEAMLAAAEDLKRAGKGGTLVIVSDGESTCEDPCEAARTIREEGGSIETITVGFQISEEGQEELQCITDELDGTYLDAAESEELRTTLDRLSRPQVEVQLKGPTLREAVAGGDEIEIAATVRNAGKVEARDVIAQLTFRAQGIEVRRPVVRVGNLAADSSANVVWRVRAGQSREEKTVPFTIAPRADNADRGRATRGEVRVVTVGPATAGKVLRGPGSGGLAILGDSYSAGEGADLYDTRTDTDQNGCHRSDRTYLRVALGANDTPLFACSGAIAQDLIDTDDDNKEAPQLDRLEEHQRDRGPVRGVVLTMGGNDANFGNLASSCLTTFETCTRAIYPGAPAWLLDRQAAQGYVDRSLEGLEASLGSAYRAINLTINNEEVVRRRGGRLAPIIVLGYPLPIPLKGRTCAPMGFYDVRVRGLPVRIRRNYLLDSAEIDFVVRFATRLNATVEQAVRTQQTDGRVPVFYVPTTERAFQPRHTVCDDGRARSATEPYARSLGSINGAGVTRAQVERVVEGRTSLAAAGVGAVKRSMQELVHPNAVGYEAETAAILRWSTTREAASAQSFTENAPAAVWEPIASWNVSKEDLGQIAPGETPVLQGGTTYPLTVGGFAPSTSVRVVARSEPRVLDIAETDRSGRIRTRVGIPPDLAEGDHLLEVTGAGPGGRPRIVRIPFAIERPWRPSFPLVLGAVAGLAIIAGGGLLLTGGARPSGLRRRGRGT